MRITRQVAAVAAVALLVGLTPAVSTPASAAEQEPDPALEQRFVWKDPTLPLITRPWHKASGQIVSLQQGGSPEAAAEYLVSIGAIKRRDAERVPFPFDDRQLDLIKSTGSATGVTSLDRYVQRGTVAVRGGFRSRSGPREAEVHGRPQWPDGAIPTSSYADPKSLYALAESAQVNSQSRFVWGSDSNEPGFLTLGKGNTGLRFVAQQIGVQDNAPTVGATTVDDGQFWVVPSGRDFELVPMNSAEPRNQVAQVTKTRQKIDIPVRVFFLACKKAYGTWSQETGLTNRVTVNPSDKTDFSSNDPSCVPLGHNLTQPGSKEDVTPNGSVVQAGYVTEPLRDLLVQELREGDKRFEYPWRSDSWILYAEAVPLSDVDGVNWTRVPRGRVETVVPRTWQEAYQPMGEVFAVNGRDLGIALVTLGSWKPSESDWRQKNLRVAEESLSSYVCDARSLKQRENRSLIMDDSLMEQAIQDGVCEKYDTKILDEYSNGRPVDHYDNHQVALFLPEFATRFNGGIGKTLVLRNAANFADAKCDLFWQGEALDCPGDTGETLSDLDPGWNAQYRYGEIPLGYQQPINENRFQEIRQEFQ